VSLQKKVLFITLAGKYGYFDGERVRVVEYGADRHGFQPSGEGITVRTRAHAATRDDKLLEKLFLSFNFL
jgi:hypothetical protein